MLEGQMHESSEKSAVVKSTPSGDPSADDSAEAEAEGQLVEVKFPAKKAGRYNLQLMCMSGEAQLVGLPGTACSTTIPQSEKRHNVKAALQYPYCCWKG